MAEDLRLSLDLGTHQARCPRGEPRLCPSVLATGLWGGNWRGAGYRSPNPSSGPASWPLPPLGREGEAQRLLGRAPTFQPKGRMSQQRIPKSISGTSGESRLAPTQGLEYQPCLSHPPTLPRHSLPASTPPFLFNCPGPQLRLFSLFSSSLPLPLPTPLQP